MFAQIDANKSTANLEPPEPPELTAEQQARREQDQLLDDLLDDKKFPLESYLTDLEAMMTSGETPLKRRLWSRRKGVDHKDWLRYESMIRGTWNVEGTTLFVYLQRREELRQQYQQIYRDCLLPVDDHPAQLGIALKAVDSMAKLDGFIGPDVQVSLHANAAAISASGMTATDTKAELTNRTRERAQELFAAMRQRAENHAARVTASIVAKQNGAPLARVVDVQSTIRQTPGQNTSGVEISGHDGDLMDAPSQRVMSVVQSSVQSSNSRKE